MLRNHEPSQTHRSMPAARSLITGTSSQPGSCDGPPQPRKSFHPAPNQDDHTVEMFAKRACSYHVGPIHRLCRSVKLVPLGSPRSSSKNTDPEHFVALHYLLRPGLITLSAPGQHVRLLYRALSPPQPNALEIFSTIPQTTALPQSREVPHSAQLKQLLSTSNRTLRSPDGLIRAQPL